MSIVKRAFAGTMESSDVYVEVEPSKGGLHVELESVVLAQFGGAIQQVVLDVLVKQGVEDAIIRIVDRGALDCVIRARVETAILRGKGEA